MCTDIGRVLEDGHNDARNERLHHIKSALTHRHSYQS